MVIAKTMSWVPPLCLSPQQTRAAPGKLEPALWIRQKVDRRQVPRFSHGVAIDGTTQPSGQCGDVCPHSSLMPA
jgi:hypothetical protein